MQHLAMMRLSAVLFGNLLIRVAGAAGGALVGFYLAALAGDGAAVDLVLVGLLGVVVNLAELGGAIPFGVLSDRLSARTVLIISALLGAAATQLFGLSGLIAIFFLSRLLEGFSAAAITPAILSHLSVITQANGSIRGRVMSYFEISLLGGVALGTLVGGGFWDSFARTAFSVVASLYLVAAVLFWWGTGRIRSDLKVDPARSPLEGLKMALRDPLLIKLAPAWLAANAVAGLWLTPTPFLLTVQGEPTTQWLVGRFTATEVGQLSLGYALTFAAGIVIWGYVLDRAKLSRVRAMRLALTGMFGVCIWFYLINISDGWSTTQRLLVIIPYAISIMVQSGVTPAALAYLADVADAAGEGRGAAMGVYTLLLGLGNALGAGLGGWLGNLAYFNGLLLGTLVLGLIAFGALQLLPSGERL